LFESTRKTERVATFRAQVFAQLTERILIAIKP
jgi:hypothetical protein